MKRLFLLFLAACFVPGTMAAQPVDKNASNQIPGQNEGNDPQSQKIELKPDAMPSFRGGNLKDFRNWVNGQLVYPPECMRNGVSGRVVATFVVGIDGKVEDLKELSSPDPMLTWEVFRVIKKSPKWKPGTQNGEPVRVKFTMPIDFSLQNYRPKEEEDPFKPMTDFPRKR